MMMQFPNLRRPLPRPLTVLAALCVALTALIALALAPTALAAPIVATDLPVTHALTARVMAGVGQPSQILPPGASPHGYQMRPSAAAALASADVVIWIGPALAPWFGRAIAKLNPAAANVPLLDTPGLTLHPVRDAALFIGHDGDFGNDHHEDDAHDKHSHESHSHGANDYGANDPHAWLDPVNAARWLDRIAEALAKIDPKNAHRYTENAAAGKAELGALTTELHTMLAPLRGKPFIVLHDAYQYFEKRFQIEAIGAIRINDATAPSPRRIADLRRAIASISKGAGPSPSPSPSNAKGAICVFVEPQFSADLAAGVTGAQTKLGTLDPLGVSLEPGWPLYPALLRRMAESLRSCLGGD